MVLHIIIFTVSDFLPGLCQIQWPILVGSAQTPRFVEIALYKKNLPNVVVGAQYAIVLVHRTNTGSFLSFSHYVSASCNSWQTWDVSDMVSELRTSLTTQTFYIAVSRFDSITAVDSGVSLTCPQIRSLFFMESTTQEALNSNFFDSGVPINVTKEEQPLPNQTGSGSGSGANDISLGLESQEAAGGEMPVPITELFPTFSMFADGPSEFGTELDQLLVTMSQ